MASNESLRTRGRRNPHIIVNSGSGGDPSPIRIPPPATSPTVVFPSATEPRSLLSDGRSPSASSQFPRYLPAPGRIPIYGAYSVPGSSEMLLAPNMRTRNSAQYQDSPGSGNSSRRTSWSSDAGNRYSQSGMRFSPFASPFDDSRTSSRAHSRARSRAGSEDEAINTQTVTMKYSIMPAPGLLLYPSDVEKDDWLHNPDPSDPREERCDPFNKRGLTNLGGLFILLLGLTTMFLAVPILTAVRKILPPPVATCASDPNCLSDKLPLLKNQRTGLIDPDTPQSAYTKTSHDGVPLKLVFSDEFNAAGRTFYPGDDPYFEAVDLWYGVTQDLEWYDPDAVSTSNGTLNLKFDAFQNHNLNYRSGMVQSWNKLCFQGGRLEASISLPGRGDVEGFWPGFWAMGNLGRPGYPATTDGLWPYSYWDHCDAGITANQSSSDGLSLLPGMRLPACTCKAEDHPSPGFSRSAPEIDGLEASVGFMGPGQYDKATGTASQSFQAAPFDIWYQPDYGYLEVYDLNITGMNSYRGGPYQQALSGVTWLNNDWYDGNAYQTYGFEYTPGASGDITWFVGDDATWKMDQRAIRPNGNIGQRVVPKEPMSVVMNFGMSNSFATIFLANILELLPATMRFDYIRIYQVEGEESLGCDPVGYETSEYIKAHPEPYANANLTRWSETNYTWPKNSLVDGCST